MLRPQYLLTNHENTPTSTIPPCHTGAPDLVSLDYVHKNGPKPHSFNQTFGHLINSRVFSRIQCFNREDVELQGQ